MKTLKRIQILLFAIILLAGCAKHEVYEKFYIHQESTKVTSALVDIYIKGYKGIPDTKTSGLTIEPIMNEQDTVMFLVNYPEGGWEVLSADIRAPKVLVMCEGGSMTVDELASNPAEEDLYDAMGDYISYLHDNPDMELEGVIGDWGDISYELENASTREIESWVLIGTTVLTDIEEKQDHLTVTRWGQGSANAAQGKWNLYSPKQGSSSSYRCLTGCVPVAIAQMMYYLHHKIGTPAGYYNNFTVSTYIPNNSSSVTISTSHLTGTASQSFDWAMLPLNIDNTVYTDAHYKNVSSIMTQIGYATNATYTFSGTSVLVSKIKPYFKTIGINCSEPCSLDWGIVNDEIFERQMPVMLGVACSHGGHRTIIDGIYYKLKEVEKRYVRNSISGPKYKTEIETDAHNMACFNWGYGNSGMVSASGNTIWYNMYGTSWNAGGHDFIEMSNMIYGFAK